MDHENSSAYIGRESKMNWFCCLKTMKPLTFALRLNQCEQHQCQVCIDYQAGLDEPAYPMPTTILERDRHEAK